MALHKAAAPEETRIAEGNQKDSASAHQATFGSTTVSEQSTASVFGTINAQNFTLTNNCNSTYRHTGPNVNATQAFLGGSYIVPSLDIRRRIVSVPIKQSATYAPREPLAKRLIEVLQPLEDEDDSKCRQECRSMIIHGMGGVGKTQLALNFIHQYEGSFNPILWIDAHTPETVRQSFERISTALGLTYDGSPTPDGPLKEHPAVARVLKWLSERQNSDPSWLAVVDNADDTTWSVEDITPQGPKGRVIVTSQHPQSPRFLKGRCKRLNVMSMTPGEARTILLNHVQGENEQFTTTVNNLCDEVTSRVDYLALAVDLAGAYLAEQMELQIPENEVASDREEVFNAILKQYTIDFDLHKDELLQWQPFYRLSSYEKNLWTVWDTSLAAIEKSAPRSNAVAFLLFLAQFDGIHVQKELFRLASIGWGGAMELLLYPEDDRPDWLRKILVTKNQVWDDFHYRQAISPLTRYGLVQNVAGDWPGTKMHGLVQWRARKAALESSRTWLQSVVIFLLAVVWQINEDTSHSAFRQHIITHLKGMDERLLELTHTISLPADNSATVLLQLSILYKYDGNYAEAEKLTSSVLEMTGKVLSDEHPQMLRIETLLIDVYQHQGRWAKAEQMGWRLNDITKRVLGEEHQVTLAVQKSLFWTYSQLGRLEEAEELGIHVVNTYTKLFSEEDPDTLATMSQLASVYLELGRSTQAKELMEKVLEARKRILGLDHPQTITSMANLVILYYRQGNFQQAENLAVKVLELQKRILGPEHPATLTSMANLAVTYEKQRKLRQAEDLEVKTLELRRKILGSDHPSTLTSMSNLAWTLLDQSRSKEAIALMKECISMSITKLGQNHPDTRKRLEDWGHLIGES